MIEEWDPRSAEAQERIDCQDELIKKSKNVGRLEAMVEFNKIMRLVASRHSDQGDSKSANLLRSALNECIGRMNEGE